MILTIELLSKRLYNVFMFNNLGGYNLTVESARKFLHDIFALTGTIFFSFHAYNIIKNIITNCYFLIKRH